MVASKFTILIYTCAVVRYRKTLSDTLILPSNAVFDLGCCGFQGDLKFQLIKE